MSDFTKGTTGLPIDDGPPGWRIWRAAMAGAPAEDGWESLIYSDSYFGGEITEGLGPFQLFATMAEPLRRMLAPRLVLRIHWHDPGQAPERSRTKIKKEGSTWLALNIDAEIACLLSLIVGCRARSGGKVRTFSPDDPTGRPMYAEHTAPVALVPAYRVPMMPHLAEARFQVQAITKSLARYPYLRAQDAVVLVRAARHYATALWVADSDPEQAWLQLVSALEAVATRWKTATADPVTLFSDHFPEPARLIRNSSEEISCWRRSLRTSSDSLVHPAASRTSSTHSSPARPTRAHPLARTFPRAIMNWWTEAVEAAHDNRAKSP